MRPGNKIRTSIKRPAGNKLTRALRNQIINRIYGEKHIRRAGQMINSRKKQLVFYHFFYHWMCAKNGG